jgi:ATP-dependent DNA helicase UvrD/PcrA
MPTFKLSCVFCGQHLEAETDWIGLESICPSCNKNIIIQEEQKKSQNPFNISHDFLSNLNEEQVQAVTTTEGYVRVIAGAGSGKTRVLTNRLVYLIRELGILPDNILSVTFTNKAAGEMKKRVIQLLGSNGASRIHTFHGFCVTILREDIHHLFFPNSFMILDGEDQKIILREIYEELNLKSSDYKYKTIIDMIAQYKIKCPYIEYLAAPDMTTVQMANPFDDPNKYEIVKRYLHKQRKNYTLDYDDLINFVFYIFSNFKHVLEKWQERIQYVQVDEFQDVSGRQYGLAEMLSGKYKNLFVVGDPDQTIYSWRGANVKFLLEFPANNTIILNKNYRSNPGVLTVSNSLIKHNAARIEKDLIPIKKDVEKAIYFHGQTVQEEALWIARMIKTLVKKNNVGYSDFAVLYRASHVSRSVEEGLVKNKISYTLFNGTEFYKRKEIKDSLCFLRLLAFEDDISFLRIINEPPRGIGKKRIELLKQYAMDNNISLLKALKENINHKLFVQTGKKAKLTKTHADAENEPYIPISAADFLSIIEKSQIESKDCTISDLLNKILTQTKYEAYLLISGDEERKNNLEELKNSIYSYETQAGENISLVDYLNQIALFTDISKTQKENSVSLMTIHSAKGLEFPYVFVCGLNEGIFPTSHALKGRDIEEERRIAYVAFTRAEEQLFLSDAAGYNFNNSFRHPSRFLLNIDKSLFDITGEIDDDFWKNAEEFVRCIAVYNPSEDDAIDALKVGSKVRHKQFGAGVVRQIITKDNAVVVDFEHVSRTINASILEIVT